MLDAFRLNSLSFDLQVPATFISLLKQFNFGLLTDNLSDREVGLHGHHVGISIQILNQFFLLLLIQFILYWN